MPAAMPDARLPHPAPPETAPGLPDLPQGPLQGRPAFQQAVRNAIAHAAAAPARFGQLVFCDPDFADWPLGERAVTQALQAWALRGHGQLLLLACRYDEVQRLHPLFVQWRRLWSHKIEARACCAAHAADLPGVLWTPAWALRRFSPLQSVCVAGHEADRRATLRAELDDWLARSAPAFAASVLGL